MDLTLIEPKYRQALLFTAIEGLVHGGEFEFIDNRSVQAIEDELNASGLVGYHWVKTSAGNQGRVTYMVRKGGHGHFVPSDLI